MTFLAFDFRYPFCRASHWWSPFFSFQAKVFPLPPAITRCSLLRQRMLTACKPPPVSSRMCASTYSLSYSDYLRICQKTVSRSTYSGLPVLPSARLCLSWSGFREADSYVRSDHLYISVDLRYFTDGDSSLYDGTPLVGQSVARVRTSSHSKKVLHLVVNVASREPRSFLCLSTTVLDPLAFLKDPRLRREVLSISACATNGLLFSGSRTTLHSLVEIPARYFHASPSSFHSWYDTANVNRLRSLDKLLEQCQSPITT